VWRGNAFLDLSGKLALGCTSEVIQATGSSSLLTGAVETRTLPGGIFVLPSNFGRRSQDEFAIVPELALKVGCQFNSHLRGTIGYNVLFWSRVARPGEQIDPHLSPGQIPTFTEFGTSPLVTSPRPIVTSTDFWAQGVSVGLEFAY
jgi:hypothetical protein